ncbi:MAG TPA: hypothetical protein VGB17_03290 [Pyrinomonadaceae bacterium]|jgi:hypothetical protein
MKNWRGSYKLKRDPLLSIMYAAALILFFDIAHGMKKYERRR